jgi:protein gp37
MAKEKAGGPAFPNGFGLTLRPKKLQEPQKLRKPTLIFVNSMSDMFWEKIPDEFRLRMLDTIRKTPHHEYQVLTKRPERMLEFSLVHPFPANLWAGVSIENKATLFRLDALRTVKASLRFVSFEPLLQDLGALNLEGIDWVIVGGESGPHLFKEEVRIERSLAGYENKRWFPRKDRSWWVEEILTECSRQGVKFFFKQWGGHRPESAGRLLHGRTYSAVPKFPGNNTELQNEYLKKLEGRDR